MLALGLVGSPRENGNTAILVSEILAGTAERGAETKLIHVAKLSLHGCAGCMACKSGDTCAIQDDMQAIYADLHAADIVVLGSPMYFGQMTSQTKALVDRLFALLGPGFKRRLLGDKRLILAFTQGAQDTSLWEEHVRATGEMLGHVGLSPAGSIIVGGTGAPGDISKQPDELAKARELGRQVAAL